jgi:hypothetical protein
MNTEYFVSIGAGKPGKPAVVSPIGIVVCIATSYENAEMICKALNR